MTITDELRVIVEAEVERAVRDMEKWDDRVSETEKKLDALEKSADRMANRMMLVSGGFIAAGTAGLKFAADIETQKTALEVLTGSAETASKVFDDLQSLATKTPLSVNDINAAATQLLNFGTSTEDVTKTLKTLGDVSMGNAGKLDTVVRAYGRMQMKGKATMEELNMLTEAGVPILGQLADGMGVATDEIFKMAATGKVSFSDVQTALAALTGEGGKFHNMLERQSATLSGKLSTALDNLKISSAKLMESLIPMAKDLLDAVSRAAESFQALDAGTKRALVGLLAVGAAAGPIAKTGVAVIGLVKGIASLGPTVTKIAPLLLNPWTALVVGITAATAAVITYIAKQREAMREATANFFTDPKKRFEQMAADWNESLSKYWDGKAKMDSTSLDAYVKKFNDGMKKIGSAATTTRQEVIQAIHDISMPDDFISMVSVLKISDKELVDIENPYKQLEKMILVAKKRISDAANPPENKKLWADWFEEITGIEKELFSTKDKNGNLKYSGAEAARLYLDGVGSELKYAEAIGAALGEKIDPSPYLEKERENIKKTLVDLLKIDPKDIDDTFKFGFEIDKTGDAKMDASVKALIDRYKELSRTIAQTTAEREKLAESEELSKRAADLVKSIETPLDRYKARLAEIDEVWRKQKHEGELLNEEQLLRLTAAAADEYRAALAGIAKQEEAVRAVSFDEWLETLTEEWLKNAGMADEAAQAYARVGVQIAMIAIDGLVDGFKDLGEAWADGSLSAEELGDALGQIAQKILDQLPMLFVQAGLQLITQGQWALGMGFIAGGFASSIISGLTEGLTANAKGNVFDSGALIPFAQGGAFTNGVVSKATRFNIGEMGEKGPEAIVPLTRMSDGSLGVASSGGDAAVPTETNVYVRNYTGAPVKTRESSAGGIREIELIVGNIVDSNLASGRHDKALGGRFGVTRKGIRG